MRLLWPEKSWVPPEGQRKTGEPFRSANFPVVMLFRRCAARCLRAKMSVLQSATFLTKSVEAVGCSLGNIAATGELGRVAFRKWGSNNRARVPNETNVPDV